MPFLVEKLIEERPFPVTVGPEVSITVALDLMVEDDYSQLPVVAEDKHPVGMVTYEGILHGVRNFKAELKDLHVRDVMTNAPQFNTEDDLFELLEQLKKTYAVLIMNSEGELAGIVTSFDSTEFFRNRAEDLMHVEDIEFMVKDFVLLAYADGDGVVDEPKLSEAVAKVSPREGESNPPKFDDLSLGQYISLLVRKNTWDVFDPIFQMPRSSVINLLENIRATRNDLAHFRSEISAAQAKTLRFCAGWLARCKEEFEKKNQTFAWDLSQLSATEEQTTATLAEPELYSIAKDKTAPGQESPVKPEPVAEEKHQGESRYAPLADLLQGQPGSVDKLQLSFDDIESVLGSSLPVSARTHRSWWANDSQSHPQSRLWLEVGWRATFINMTEGRITFMRIREREKAYIDFFGRLLTDLRLKADFPIRDASPDGSNWITCQSIASHGHLVCYFNYSFTRGQRFRAEIYIDTNDQETNKKIFDLIQEQRERLEAAVDNITWERIDDKRASRIAIYHAGAITDSEESLAALRKWAVNTMIIFYEAVEPIAVRAIDEVLSS